MCVRIVRGAGHKYVDNNVKQNETQNVNITDLINDVSDIICLIALTWRRVNTQNVVNEICFVNVLGLSSSCLYIYIDSLRLKHHDRHTKK